MFILTDNEECPSGWYTVNNSCFYIESKEAQPWFVSRIACWELGGDLALVADESLRQNLSDILDKHNFGPNDLDHFFIGASSRIRNQWFWINGAAVNDSLWAPNWPRMIGDCGSVSYSKKGWRLSDSTCDYRYPYICEKKESKCKRTVFFTKTEVFNRVIIKYNHVLRWGSRKAHSRKQVSQSCAVAKSERFLRATAQSYLMYERLATTKASNVWLSYSHNCTFASGAVFHSAV